MPTLVKLLNIFAKEIKNTEKLWQCQKPHLNKSAKIFKALKYLVVNDNKINKL